MRILLSHNFYRSSAPSGEDSVFLNELQMLENGDNDVIKFTKHNDELVDKTIKSQIETALSASWSRDTYREISEIIHRTKPDIAHFHNTFPQISPSAYAACMDNGVSVVQTLHNYRLICAGAMLYRNNSPCEDCIPGKRYPGLIHRCYRNSFLATAAVTRMLRNNWRNGVYTKLVTRYIALSEFAKMRFISGGLPEYKISRKPNFLPLQPKAGPGGASAVFVGRLSMEKGIHTLLEAWEAVKKHRLTIIGDGPLRYELEQIARERKLNVKFVGFLSRDEIFQYVRNALVQIIPSETYEGFPMVILEAYACGTPVLASRLGSLDEVVTEGETGLKFEPRNANDLALKLKDIFEAPLRLQQLRTSVRKIFDENYTEQRNLVMLIDIYNKAIAHQATASNNVAK